MKYIGWQRTCDAAFGVFVFSWLFARHIAYGAICWSFYVHANETVMPYGTYSLVQTVDKSTSSGTIVTGARLSADGGDGVFANMFQPFVYPGAETLSFNANIRWSFLGLLAGLQAITILWFIMICRVVVKVLRGEGAEDCRSDDEGDEEGQAEYEEEAAEDEGAEDSEPSSNAMDEKKFIEIEADGADMYRGPNRCNGGVAGHLHTRKGLSSGLNLGDRKEILNRIGCLSEEQLSREREKRGPRGESQAE